MKNKVEEKEEIRSSFLNKRNELSKEQCKTDSLTIAKRVLSLKQLQKAETIFVYASYKNEVETRRLIQKLLSMGKRVALPKVREKEMDFFLIHSWQELVFGYHGILEPDGAGELVVPTKQDVMLMPGVAFDLNGNRIGYGGGYYDRYLEQQKENIPCLIGLGYELQLFPKILPTEPQDKQVNFVVTEKKAYKIKRKKKHKRLGWIVDIIDIVIDFVIELIN